MPKTDSYAANRIFEDEHTGVLINYFNDEAMKAGWSQRMYPIRNAGGSNSELVTALQHLAGDALIMTQDGLVKSVDFKCERRQSPNLFIETYSNMSDGGLKNGWLYTLKCDRLWYYFADTRRLLVVNFPELRKWLLEPQGDSVRLLSFRERCQRTHAQKNKTIGRLVPIASLPAGILVRDKIIPPDIPAWPEAALNERPRAAA